MLCKFINNIVLSEAEQENRNTVKEKQVCDQLGFLLIVWHFQYKSGNKGVGFLDDVNTQRSVIFLHNRIERVAFK